MALDGRRAPVTPRFAGSAGLRGVGGWCISVTLLMSSIAHGQSPARGGTAGPANDFEVWAGYSPRSTDLGFLGRHNDLSLAIAGLRINRLVRVTSGGAVYYTADAIPFALVDRLVTYLRPYSEPIPPTDDSRCHRIPYRFDCIRSEVPAHGAGLNPIGFTFVQNADRRVQWRVGANGGVLWFDRSTPTDISTKFNFTASLEGGLQLTRSHGDGLLLVYRMHHLSNAGRGQDNLAMLSHVFSAGFRWR